jgi:allantoicase
VNDFRELLDLASARVGGRVLAANDEFFAPKENLLKPEEPVFLPGEYTDRGKWMDGWETRRRREPGHDWCLVRLGLPGSIAGVVVDTRHFKGNFPESFSLEACALEGDPGAEQEMGEASWTEILPQSRLSGDAENPFRVADSRRFSHLRLNIFPDGGVARLRVYGRAHPDRARLAAAEEVDLAAAENGGLVVAASDMFFGSRHNLILPGAPTGMHDGWETRRRRGPGYDWAIVRLGLPGRIRRVSVDTTHFKGNAPGSCSIDVSEAPEETELSALLSSEETSWRELLPRVPLKPHAMHEFAEELRTDGGPATHARLNIHPDGGVARLRLWGAIAGP